MDKKEMNVVLTNAHLKRSGKVSSSDALSEIIWNAIDADANNIYISLKKENEIDVDKVTSVLIEDDGIGLQFNSIGNSLLKYGESEKSFSKCSPSGRIYHGKLGEGRYTYQSIGKNVKWDSFFISDSEIKQFSIGFGIDSTKITITDPVKSDSNHTGLHVTISDLSDEAEFEFSKTKNIVQEITKEFSPYLLAYGNIHIFFEGIEIKPKDAIETEKEYTKQISGFLFSVLIIKWKDIKSNEIFLSGEGNAVYLHEQYEDFQTECTIFLKSHFIDKAKIDGSLELIFASENGPLINQFIEESYELFIHENEAEMNRSFLENLKSIGAYPYSEIPTNIVDKEQKALFDVVAVELNKVAPKISTSNKDTKRLTYNLINEAIKTNPKSLNKILAEVFKLTPDQQNDFAKLLNKTSMAAIVSTMQEVTDRLSFLEELTKLVYTDNGKYVHERTQFQKLLIPQLWIFGDKYKYGVDDVSLRNVLKAYISELDMKDIFLSEDDEKNTDFNKIPDIVLWNNQSFGEIFENLVVEIKRPTFTLGEKELGQIKKYAFTIIGDSRFSPANYTWRFILIGKEIDKMVKTEMEGWPNGMLKTKNASIEVMTWADLIGQNKHRYQYFKEKAKINFKEDDISSSLSERWKQLLGDKAPK